MLENPPQETAAQSHQDEELELEDDELACKSYLQMCMICYGGMIA